MDYERKYLKYKAKYLTHKLALQTGGTEDMEEKTDGTEDMEEKIEKLTKHIVANKIKINELEASIKRLGSTKKQILALPLPKCVEPYENCPENPTNCVYKKLDERNKKKHCDFKYERGGEPGYYVETDPNTNENYAFSYRAGNDTRLEKDSVKAPKVSMNY